MASTEQSPQESADRRFEALVNGSSNIMAVLDAKGNFTFANQTTERALGFTLEELLSTHISQLLHPEDLATAEETFADVVPSPGRDPSVVLRMQDKYGNYRAFHVMAHNCLRHEAVNGIVINAHEVTEILETQERLKKSEAQLRDFFNNAKDLIEWVDQDGNILGTNAAWKTAFGAGEQESAGRSAFDIVAPEVREDSCNVFSRLIRGEKIDRLATILLANNGGRMEVEGSLYCQHGWGNEAEVQIIFRDVTARNQAQRRSDELGQLYRAILQSANYIIISADMNGTIQTFNGTAEKMLGYSAEELVGRATCSVLHDPEEVKAKAQELSEELGEIIEPGLRVFTAKIEKTGAADRQEWTLIRKDGSRFPALLRCNGMYGPEGQLLGFVAVATDITERKRAEAELQRTHHRLRMALEQERAASRCDHLTSLTNRRAFYEMGEFETKRAKRYQRAMTLIYIDVDDFKTVNDTQGHHSGDDLLMQVATTIKQTVRQTDIPARVGGDEFAVLLPETDAQGAAVLVDRLQSALSAEMQKNGWPVTFSIGCVTSNESHLVFDDLVTEADAMMYRSKRGGKNRCTVARGGKA